ncbi:MAG TPA: SWIM zinc finger family protein [Puia sp.]|nr:SWIM zinc finger family protein [Puia sp.]
MTLENFEQLQPDKELKKGMAYYQLKNITSLKKRAPGQWKAEVRGSEIYAVEISLQETEIVEVDCDCPVGMPYCKHVIAVLYALREALGEAPPEPRLPMEKEDHEKARCEKIIRDTARVVTESYGGIEIDSISHVMRPVITMLDEAKTALRKKNYDQAAGITLAVIETMAEIVVYMEQSSYHPEDCIYEGFELLKKLAAADIPAPLRARLIARANREAVKRKYEEQDFDNEWPDLVDTLKKFL